MIKGTKKYIFLVIYVFIMLYELLGSDWRIKNSVKSYNLIPFSTISRYFKYTKGLFSATFCINILGNIAFFIPLGFLLPVCFKKIDKYYLTIPISIGIVLLLETTQYFLAVGVFDIDDIILNTIGITIGYLIYIFSTKKNKRSMKI